VGGGAEAQDIVKREKISHSRSGSSSPGSEKKSMKRKEEPPLENR